MTTELGRFTNRELGLIAMCVRMKLRKDEKSAGGFGDDFDQSSPMAGRIRIAKAVLTKIDERRQGCTS